MWILAVMALAVATFASFLAGQSSGERTLAMASDAALAQTMAVERAAAVEWARGHPHRQGELGESEVTPPAWSRTHPRLRVAIRGRIVAVYLVGQKHPGVLAEMTRLSRGSILVGVANRRTGTLHSPAFGDTGIELPDAVPDQAPVWLAVRD